MKHMKRDKCLYCEITASPRQYFDWIAHINKHWVVGIRLNEDILCVFKEHNTMPGGHNLNEIVDVLAEFKGKDERLEFEDSGHYRIHIRKRGNHAGPNNS